jgi:hypothetical protein
MRATIQSSISILNSRVTARHRSRSAGLLLFLLLLLPRLRGVEVVIVIGWRDVVAIPGEVLQRLHRRREVLARGPGGRGGGIGTGGGIGPLGAESSVPTDADATAISLVPGGKTSTNASAAMIAGTATTACSRRERLRARTAALTSQRLIRPSTPVAIAHSAAVSGPLPRLSCARVMNTSQIRSNCELALDAF